MSHAVPRMGYRVILPRPFGYRVIPPRALG